MKSSRLFRKNHWRRPIRGIVVALVAALAATAGVAAPFFGHEVDVITVTDVTKQGKKYRVPTPEQPIYYMMIDLGQKVIVSDMDHSGQWVGEELPDRAAARNWVIAALAEQGYQPGDLDKHTPSILIFYSWGMVQGGDTVAGNADGSVTNPSRPALKFLGGDKVGLMWEMERIGQVDGRLFQRNFERMGVKGKVWDFSGSNLFLGRVEAFTIDSLKAKKKTLLWETRFAALADGLSFKDSLPLMVKAAAPNFGRETTQPVNLNASRAFGGSVRMDDIKILGDVPPVPEDFPDLPAKPETGEAR